MHVIKRENDVKEMKPNPVACHICNKVLSTKYVAAGHIKRVHEKAYVKKCLQCGKNLTRYDLNCHNCINGFTCQKNFSTKYSFARHAAKFHNGTKSETFNDDK